MDRRALARRMIFAVWVVMGGVASVAWAQPVRDWETTVSWHNRDYFAHTRDRELNALLQNVETYHMGKGFWEYYRKEQYNYAIDDVKYVLRVFPNHPKALELMSTISRLMKRPALPLPWFQKAITMFPQYALTRAQLGGYLMEIGEVELAVTELERAIEMAPELAYAHARLARAYQRKGNAEAARASAERAQALGFKGKALE